VRARAIARRQPGALALTSSAIEGASSRFARSGRSAKANRIGSRSFARMMQPPFQMRAISLRFKLQA
jgi:hypothetical protein